MDAHITGMSPSSCLHTSNAIADVFLNWDIFNWDSRLPLNAAGQAVCHGPLPETDFAGSSLSTWNNRVAMTVPPGRLQ